MDTQPNPSKTLTQDSGLRHVSRLPHDGTPDWILSGDAFLARWRQQPKGADDLPFVVIWTTEHPVNAFVVIERRACRYRASLLIPLGPPDEYGVHNDFAAKRISSTTITQSYDDGVALARSFLAAHAAPAAA